MVKRDTAAVKPCFCCGFPLLPWFLCAMYGVGFPIPVSSLVFSPTTCRMVSLSKGKDGFVTARSRFASVVG